MVISETEGSQRKKDVFDRRLSLIDVSSTDDSLIAPVSGNPVDHQHSDISSENQHYAALLDTPYSKKFEDAINEFEAWEQEPQPKEAFEIEKAKKNSNCNFRKSLAWDSAFFTSAGVLDPEELSSIIEGVENDEKHALLGIQEDVHKSCESIFTLESDSLTLESLEAGLFEDIRASIQKSSKMSSATNGNRKVPSGGAGYQTSDPSKKVGMASQKKALPSSKNTSANMQGSGKMTKKNPISPQVPQKLVATRGELSILKQPKVPRKSSPSSTSAKRTSLGNLHVKSEKDKAKREISGRVSLVSKAPVLGGSQGFMPKPTPSFNSSSGLSNPNKTKSATSASSGSNSSDNIGKSPFKSSKRKVDAGTITVSSSGSAVHKGRDKTDSGNPSLSGSMHVTKLSSSISPASSSSDWSSESSWPISMTKCRSNSSTTSLGSSSGRKVLSDTDTSQPSNSQNPLSDFILEGQETQEARFKSQSARTTSARAVLPLASMKPSGLRLPSPKIGFFDGVKSLVRTPRGGMEKHIANYQKAPVFCQLDVINDLHLHKVANYRKNYDHDDQVDCLSRQVGVVDINIGSQKKIIGDCLSFSHSDVSFQDKSKGLELSSQELLNCRKMEKSMNGPCTPSFDIPTYTRRPLTVKNSFCNVDGFFSVLQNQQLQS